MDGADNDQLHPDDCFSRSCPLLVRARGDVLRLTESKLGPVKIYRANSGAVSFRVVEGNKVNFVLSSMDDIHKNILKIVFCFGLTRMGAMKYYRRNNDPHENDEEDQPLDVLRQDLEEFNIPRSDSDNNENDGYWLSWKNNQLKLGIQGQQEPFYTSPVSQLTKNIGYIKFEISTALGFYEAPPAIREIKTKYFEDGLLCWRRMVDGHLPAEAMIGGFENEPIYIARAEHRRSLSPGKFVPSKKRAFIAWGHRAHEKNEFEILCGYNARWVKTEGKAIPENAFIGGYSEVKEEPLYIGRAMVDGSLICGKVHLLYNTCYLPCNELEIEVHSYEVLVMPYVLPRVEPPFSAHPR